MNNQLLTLSIIAIGIFVVYYNSKLSSDNSGNDNIVIIDKDEDNSGLVKPEHLLKKVLTKYSNGEKISLQGNCNVNLYTKDIINVDMKQESKDILNYVFKKIYKLTNTLCEVQEINNIYEQIDRSQNKRYIIDATLHSVNNHYTVKVIVDIVKFRGDVYINYINTNEASNNNILNRYDTINYNQGILDNKDNFINNVRKLLDTHYKDNYKVIGVKDDTINYDLNKVLSLKSLTNVYFPSTISSETKKELSLKGIKDRYEMYLPSTLNTIKSKQYCKKYLNEWSSDGILLRGKENCVFNHNTTTTEVTQPYNAPGLFFTRNSYLK